MDILSTALRLFAAAVSGAAIGYERGRYGRAAGLRTHMLVAIGSAIASLVGIYMTTTGGAGDPSRIPSGVVSGIGFIGAGIILIKGSNKITGLTTAAAMWATSAVGLAYGAGFYAGGLIGTLIIMFILTVMIKLETDQKKDYLYFIEIEDAYDTNRIYSEINRIYPNAHSGDILPSKSGIQNHIGIAINIYDDSTSGRSVEETIRNIPGVVFIVRE